MNKIEFQHLGVNYVRISKAAARRAFEAGQGIIMVPVRLSPWYLNGVFVCGPFRRSEVEDYVEYHGFNSHVQDYEYYNCNSNETGYYTQFYVAKEGEDVS